MSVTNDSYNATVTRVEEDVWELTICAKEDIEGIAFPWAEDTAEFVYSPLRGGEKIPNVDLDGDPDKNPLKGWRISTYPGKSFAPLVITDLCLEYSSGECVRQGVQLLAAQNWPPRTISSWSKFWVQTLVYWGDEGDLVAVEAGELVTLRARMTRIENGTWHDALDLYRSWLEPHLLAEGLIDDDPLWMRLGHGYLVRGLNNIPDANLTEDKLDRQLALQEPGAGDDDPLPWADILPWIQFWGQMSGHAESCCALNPNLHSRYIDVGLLEWVEDYLAEDPDRRVGFYSRPYPYGDAGPVYEGSNATWTKQWQDRNFGEPAEEGSAPNSAGKGANAGYVDVLGASYFGDGLSVARFIRDELPPDVFIEGAVDIYPKASLISNAYDIGYGDPRLVRYLLNRRIMYLGESNGEEGWGEDDDHWLERQVFLLGMKFDAMHPNQVVRDIAELRDANLWWARDPRYMDTQGIRSISEPDVEARMFVDSAGLRLLAVDNWEKKRGTITLGTGQVVTVSPNSQLSIITVPPSTP